MQVDARLMKMIADHGPREVVDDHVSACPGASGYDHAGIQLSSCRHEGFVAGGSDRARSVMAGNRLPQNGFLEPAKPLPEAGGVGTGPESDAADGGGR